MAKLDPVLLLLTALIAFFTIVLVGVAHFHSSDGQTFQVLGNSLSGIIGALLMRVKTESGPSAPPPGGSSSTVTVENVATPPVLPKVP